ncbi:MAG: S41 family peptidase [Patescibacteria group bacterium]|nr:S41 family peptidase [Patescibacteria group bacterium]MCL5261756.1 S41 family peptidase [Patescibacteria group bacterium]
MMKKRILIGVSLVILLVGATAGAFYIGYKKGFAETKIIEIKGVADINPNEKVNADFGVFWQAWDKIKSKYVKAKDVKDQDLVYGAINGMLESLGDPYTIFMNPEDAKKFTEDVNGNFGGIGAELENRDNQVVVVAPLKGTPAERAGLKPGDIILQAGDVKLTDIDVSEAVKIIRGDPGTEITLLIMREGFAAPKEFKITREIIEVPTLDWSWKNNKIAYIQLYNFNQVAPSAFYRAIVDTVPQGARGVILDLRNNPGGYLDVAVNIAGWFLKPGETVVSEKFANGDMDVLRASGTGALQNMPVVVLVNSGSASASEILAGALRDNRGIKIVGEKTFGKGTVQELEDLKDGSVLKITIASWVMPGGKILNGSGITPDYAVDLTDDDAKNDRDPQLDKAIEVLESQITVGQNQ